MIFLFHSEVTEESFDGTKIGHSPDTRILDTLAFPTVSMVAFLRSFLQEEHNSVIHHGTMFSGQSRRTSTRGSQGKQPKRHSGSSRRTSDTTLDGWTEEFGCEMH